MSRNPRALIATWGLFVAGSAPLCEAATADPNPVVLIKVENPNGLPTDGLARARELTTDIYARAGVTLRWTPDTAAEPDTTLTVVLTTSTAVPPGLGADAMGVAPSPGDGTRGTIAYVFLEKVLSFAAASRLPIAPVLACALTHEIGHLLLPPNAHRPDSVMRDSWHPALFPPRSPGILGFPQEQARLLPSAPPITMVLNWRAGKNTP